MDPLAEKMVYSSPYSYAFNNSIRFIDVAGLYPWPILLYNSRTGNYSFKSVAIYLLSLTTGVNKDLIRNTISQERKPMHYRPFYSADEGGGAITIGNKERMSITYTENFFEDNLKASNGNGFGLNVNEWLNLSSHEVGHSTQIQKYDNQLGYIVEIASQYEKFRI